MNSKNFSQKGRWCLRGPAGFCANFCLAIMIKEAIIKTIILKGYRSCFTVCHCHEHRSSIYFPLEQITHLLFNWELKAKGNMIQIAPF